MRRKGYRLTRFSDDWVGHLYIRGGGASVGGFYQEMTTLAKKNPHDPLNKFKLGLVNSTLVKANAFLGNERVPFPDFEVFDDVSMPSVSDALVILSGFFGTVVFAAVRTRTARCCQNAFRSVILSASATSFEFLDHTRSWIVITRTLAALTFALP